MKRIRDLSIYKRFAAGSFHQRLNTVLLAAVGVLLIAIGVLFGLRLSAPAKKPEVVVLSLSATAEPSAAPASTAVPAASTPLPTPTPTPISFVYSLNARPVFKTGAEQGTLFLENPKENTGSIKVLFYLDATDELLYVSPLVAPGDSENYGTLTVPLEKGEYAVTAAIQLFDDDGETVLAEVTTPITVVVQG